MNTSVPPPPPKKKHVSTLPDSKSSRETLAPQMTLSIREIKWRTRANAHSPRASSKVTLFMHENRKMATRKKPLGAQPVAAGVEPAEPPVDMQAAGRWRDTGTA